MKKAGHISETGFSLVDLIVVVAVIAVISGITIPLMLGAIDRMRLGQSAREVERELQQAKQRAVGKSSVMRVHFNCPTAREYRSVELIGTPSAPLAADTASATRCGTTGVYPFPALDNNPLTRPNLDGPARFLDPTVTFGAVQSIEFWSDGTAHYNNAGANPWPMIPTAGITLTMVRSGKTASITVNGLGKVQLQ
jgi:type II secretory pathway pseudopilin PulG